MELSIKNPHFKGRTKGGRQRQICLKGGVLLQVGGKTLSTPEEHTERCLPAVAIRFLRSLFQNHFAGTHQPLIPSEPCRLLPLDTATVLLDGVPLGVDLDILHENGSVLLRGVGGFWARIPYGEYREAVLHMARQVRDAYTGAPPRQPERELDRRGYRAFMGELVALLEQAKVTSHRKPPRIQAPDFREPLSYSDRQIKTVSAAGIAMSDQNLLSLRQCAYYFRRMNGGEGRIVGEREFVGQHPCVRLYTHPTVTEIHFLPNSRPKWRHSPDFVEKYVLFEDRLLALGYGLVDVETQ
ncbi:MAG: hypothetical protein E7620_04495 [Ruminococcaceae bacterium]|nr:hypothetical protein [Oscillospiraceae bacterium]